LIEDAVEEQKLHSQSLEDESPPKSETPEIFKSPEEYEHMTPEERRAETEKMKKGIVGLFSRGSL